MLQYRLNITFWNVNIDDPRNCRVLLEVIAQTMKVHPLYSSHKTLIQCRFHIEPSSATLAQQETSTGLLSRFFAGQACALDDDGR